MCEGFVGTVHWAWPAEPVESTYDVVHRLTLVTKLSFARV